MVLINAKLLLPIAWSTGIVILDQIIIGRTLTSIIIAVCSIIWFYVNERLVPVESIAFNYTSTSMRFCKLYYRLTQNKQKFLRTRNFGASYHRHLRTIACYICSLTWLRFGATVIWYVYQQKLYLTSCNNRKNFTVT